MRREAGVGGIETQDLRSPGSLSSAISRLVVGLVSEYTGRGPTKARTSIRDNVVVCVTMDNMTKGERTLVDAGEGDAVVTIRRKFQTTMRDDLVGGIETLTGRKVVSFLSDHDAVNDHAIEAFVLDGPPELERATNGDVDPTLL
jgi:uncharacterized protein YbcI